MQKAIDTTGKEDTRCWPVATQSNGPNDKRGACIVHTHNQHDGLARGYAPTARQCASEKLTAAEWPIFFALPSFGGANIPLKINVQNPMFTMPREKAQAEMNFRECKLEGERL